MTKLERLETEKLERDMPKKLEKKYTKIEGKHQELSD